MAREMQPARDPAAETPSPTLFSPTWYRRVAPAHESTARRVLRLSMASSTSEPAWETPFKAAVQLTPALSGGIAWRGPCAFLHGP
jgi:hypothetical protein